MSGVRIAVLIWLAGVAVRLILAFGLDRYDLFRPEPVKIAISLARSGKFADPYAVPTGFTAHAAPLYPAMLAPIYYFWGDRRRADFLRIIFSIIAASASYALLPSVAQALRMRPAVGILAGAVGAILPAHYWPESMGEFETAWVPLFLEASVILLARLEKSAQFTLTSALATGVWCGIAVLFSPNLLPPLLGLWLLAIWRIRAWRRWSGIVIFAALGIVAPWIVRNDARLGGVFFVRDNFGLELYVSNNDAAKPDVELNDVSLFFQREHPFFSADVALEIRDRGELNFERERLHRALKWIRASPVRFIALTGARIYNFWVPARLRPLPRFLIWILNLFAIGGMILLLRENQAAVFCLGSMLVSYPAIYYLINNGIRYEHGVYWVTLLLAAQLGLNMPGRSKWRFTFLSRWC